MSKKKTEDACPWVLVLILLPFAFMGFCFSLNAVFSFIDKVNTTAVEVQELKAKQDNIGRAYWEEDPLRAVERANRVHFF
jgi:hypothetical protein